jgi:hypothetical protein
MNADGSVKMIIDYTIPREFLIWLGEKALSNTPEDEEFTPGIFKAALKAVQDFLNQQCAQHKLSNVEQGYVRKLPNISALIKDVERHNKSKANDDMKDPQARLDISIDPGAMLRGMRDLYSFAEDTALSELTALARIQLIATLRTSIAIVCRGEELRYANLGSLFTWQLRGVGPGPFTEALCMVANCGKTNKSGRRTTTGCIPNMNALLCAVAAIGMSFVYRFQCAKEPHPRFTDYKQLFAIAFIRATAQPYLSISYNTMYTHTAALFKFMQVAPPGVTHYGRQEGHQELDQRGVLESQISRLANRDGGGGSQVVKDSYLVNLPVQAVVASGGYDQTALRAVVAPHHVHVPAALLYFLLPWLREQEQLVATAVDAAKRVRGQMEADRLFAAQGSLRAVRHAVTTFVQCCAARPRKPDGGIDASSPPMYALFPNNPVYKCMNEQGFFDRAEFREILRLVLANENAELGDGGSALASDWSPVTARFKQVVDPGFAAVLSQQRSIFGMVQSLESRMGTLVAASSSSSSLVTALSSSSSASLSAPPAGGAALVPVAAPTQGGRRKDRFLSLSAGEIAMVPLSQHANVESLWAEYATGANGTTALRQLEAAGDSWRNKAAGKRFSEQGPLYRYIEGRMSTGRSEDDALRDLQSLLDEEGSRGASKAPNWYALLKLLRDSPEEADRPKRKARLQRRNDDSAESAFVLTGGGESQVQFMADGAIRPDDGPDVILTVDTHGL